MKASQKTRTVRDKINPISMIKSFQSNRDI